MTDCRAASRSDGIFLFGMPAFYMPIKFWWSAVHANLAFHMEIHKYVSHCGGKHELKFLLHAIFKEKC